MEIEKYRDSLNTCHQILDVIGVNDDFFEATKAEYIKELTLKEASDLMPLVEDRVKQAFKGFISGCKILLNGQMSKIGRALPIHINTFRNYCNGDASDIETMLLIVKPLKEASDQKKQILETI